MQLVALNLSQYSFTILKIYMEPFKIIPNQQIKKIKLYQIYYAYAL